MTKLPKYTLSKNDNKERWELKADKTEKLVKTFDTKSELAMQFPATGFVPKKCIVPLPISKGLRDRFDLPPIAIAMLQRRERSRNAKSQTSPNNCIRH